MLSYEFLYEMKKIFTPKKTIITFAFLAIINCALFFMYSGTEEYGERQKADKIYTGEVSSKIFIDAHKHYQQIKNDPKNYADPKKPETIKEKAWKELMKYDRAEQCINDNNSRKDLGEEIKEDAKEKRGSEKLIANEYIRRVSTIKDVINGETVSISFLERYISSFLPIIMGFVITMFIAPLFSGEYELRTDSILLASRYGKNKLIRTKILAALAATVMIYVFVVFGYFLLALIKWGMFDTRASFIFIQPEAEAYWRTPYEFTMGQYFWILIAVSFAGSVVFSLFTAFLSAVMKKPIFASAVSMLSVFAFVPVIITGWNGTTSIFLNLLRFNFANIIGVRGVFNGFYAFVVGGHVITIAALLIPVLVITAVIYYMGAKWAFKNRVTS